MPLRPRKALHDRACRSCETMFSPPGHNVIYCETCKNQCQEPGCTKSVRKGAKCAKHSRVYHDVPDHVGDENGICAVAGCERTFVAKGLCELHYRRFRLTGSVGVSEPRARIPRNGPCQVDGCKGFARGDGLCITHYQRRRKHGEVGPAELLRAEMGTGSINDNGYRIISDEHGRRWFEHRLVMERKIGRKLRKGENVHHKDGNRLNNHQENLELWTVQQPNGQRVSDLIAYAISLLEKYESETADAGFKIVRLIDEVGPGSDQWETASDYIRGQMAQ